jgi:RNA polymerase sigma-70 factor (ECF subfamily)
MASISGDGADALARSLDAAPVTGSPDHEADACDSGLVEAARQGDRAAFGRLYGRYARMVHGILLAKVPLREVDDLVHDAFLQAMRRLHTLRDSTRFGPWLAAITRNRAHDYHRRSRNDVEVELPDTLSQDEVAGSKAGASPHGDDEAALLLRVIRELPETYREPLLLRLVEGMTGPEIAARTGLTPGSVRVNLHRGTQQLREKLARKTNRKPAGA